MALSVPVYKLLINPIIFVNSHESQDLSVILDPLSQMSCWSQYRLLPYHNSPLPMTQREGCDLLWTCCTPMAFSVSCDTKFYLSIVWLPTCSWATSGILYLMASQCYRVHQVLKCLRDNPGKLLCTLSLPQYVRVTHPRWMLVNLKGSHKQTMVSTIEHSILLNPTILKDPPTSSTKDVIHFLDQVPHIKIPYVTIWVGCWSLEPEILKLRDLTMAWRVMLFSLLVQAPKPWEPTDN